MKTIHWLFNVSRGDHRFSTLVLSDVQAGVIWWWLHPWKFRFL
ncbi:hypothetical protein [Photorhabdus asymbiotica]